MFKAFSRSWEITKLSFSVINKDREILLFPLLAGLFSFIFMIIVIVPAVLPAIIFGSSLEHISAISFYGIMFAIYLGVAFIATFFNVCVVYTTRVRFEGGNATFMESLQFACSKLHLIFAWSMVAATVGMLLRILQNAAERAGGIGKIIFQLILSAIGMAWSIAIVFVIPAMVYQDLGPIDAIKSSVNTIKKTWGESLIRYYGLSFVQGLINFFGIVLFGVMGVGAYIVYPPLAILFAILAVIYITVVNLAFSAANTIFNTALYEYANGSVPDGFSQELLDNAFKVK